MADTSSKGGGWLKAGFLGVLGLTGGAVGTYATAVVDRVVKPTRPVANFATAADGLTVTCQNHASGESGWWDFGDGTALETFTPDQPAVSHTYAKPGTYSVKLTVRNYLADENERTVPVEATASAKDSSPPDVAALLVKPVSPSNVAPATFRLVGEVKNAERCVWDFGDGRMEVADPGPIDRLVTFEKPGTHTIQLISHGAKTAAKQTASVTVQPPRAGSLTAVVRVTDSGSRVDRADVPLTVAVPVPQKAAGRFEKTVGVRPGSTAVAATVAGKVAGVTNLKAEPTADRRGVTVSGEWAAGAKGSDVIVPVKVTQERATALPATAETVTGVMPAGSGSVVLPLPPRPLGVAGVQRRLQLEFRETTADGRSRVVSTVPDLKLPWSGAVAVTPGNFGGVQSATQPVSVQQKGDALAVTVGY